jgi:hypothetical protein
MQTMNAYEVFHAMFNNDEDDFGLSLSLSMGRDMGVTKYGYAIPNREAISRIADFGPVLEVMAGTGFWAKLLAEEFERRGIKGGIVAIDNHSWSSENHDFQFGTFFPVLNGDAVDFATKEESRSLLMIWPYMDNVGNEVVRAYKGKTIMIVTEGRGGCCGTDEMFDSLEELFDHVEDITIPCWAGVHDYLSIWERKE